MDAKKYIQEFGRDKAKEVSESAGTTIEYFSQIAYGHRRPSVKLANRLVKASEEQLDFVSLLNAKPDDQQEAA
jgi:DNA-directed RNA polymerase subunit F